jgi:acetyl-CoA acetyltransferase family protein
MNERIAIIAGVRSPFIKSGTELRSLDADDLGASVIRKLILKSSVSVNDIDEVIIGNVAQPSKAANVARVASLKAGVPDSVPAYTVQRNCASGMEAISTSINKILVSQADTVISGGTESMSNIPFLYSKKMKSFFEKLMRARSFVNKLSVVKTFRFSHLKPEIGLLDGLTDPVCGLLMGMTAENLVREFSISRKDQDNYALESHQKAMNAVKSDFFQKEIVSVVVPSKTNIIVSADNGPKEDQSIEKLTKLRPYFDRKYGTVTVGNACPITDGAAMLILKKESEAKRLGLDVLGYIRAYDYAGLEPHRMGLGPVYATAKLFKRTGISLADIDLIEMNEAFAAQIIANLRAFESDKFSKTYLGMDKKIGEIDVDRLNVNGGAIALGHPVGATGARLIITLLHALRDKNLNRGLATLCVGGGQGASFVVEVN